jgi:hypothetical protein
VGLILPPVPDDVELIYVTLQGVTGVAR